MPRHDIRHKWCGGVALVFIGEHQPEMGDIVHSRHLEHACGCRWSPGELLICDACGRRFERLELEGDRLVAWP